MEFQKLMNELSRKDYNYVLYLYDSYEGYMCRIAAKELHSKELAEKAAYEAICRIIKCLARFTGIEKQSEIRDKIAICTRAVADNMKTEDETATVIRFDDDDDDDDEPCENGVVDYIREPFEKTIARPENRSAVRKILKAMPHELRDATMLVYYYDFSDSEAAGLLGIRQGTLRSRLYVARKRVRKGLREHVSVI